MKLFRTVTAGLLALSMSVAAVSGEIRQSAVVVHAEEPDPELLRRYAEIIVSQVNDARLAYKDPENPNLQLSELKLLPIMCDFAEVRAQEMYLDFSHNRPTKDADGNLIISNIQVDEYGNMLLNDDGSPKAKNCFSVIKEQGFFYNSAAENIAAGNVLPVGTFDQWMGSASHKKNIMGEDFTHIGIGYYYMPDSTYKYYWSMFLVGVWDPGNVPTQLEGEYIPHRELGDADGSKEIDSTDVSRILTYTCENNAGLPVRVTDEFFQASDVNGDGYVNAIDASILLSYIAASGVDASAKLEDFVWGA